MDPQPVWTFGQDRRAAEVGGWGRAVGRDGRLQWCDADGRVLSTDPATGATTRVFDSGHPIGAGRDTYALAVFSGAGLHLLSTDRRNGVEEETLSYTVLDRDSGDVVSVMAVAVPNGAVDVSTLNLSYLAVRPA